MSPKASKNLASFRMEEVDLRLQTASRLISSPSSSSLDESPASISCNQMGPIRSLGECVDIFENGPRPLSLSLALLNDEEIILLSQNGKVAAYALEKVLERAVRIRRALICTFFSFFRWISQFLIYLLTFLQLALHVLKLLKPPISH
jgi:hydroxymethylglutaryl-CoA reductase (NADPH)